VIRIGGAVDARSPVAPWLSIVPVVIACSVLAAIVIDGSRSLGPRAFALPTPGAYEPYLDDFVVFFAAGDLAGSRDGSFYELPVIHNAEARVAGTTAENTLVLPFFNPPYVAAALAPLAILHPSFAAIVWTIGSCFLIGLSLALTARTVAFTILSLLAVLLVASSMPFYQVLLHGQMTGIIMVGWALVWLSLFRGSSDSLLVAGFLLLSVKPQLALTAFLAAAAIGRWRAILAASILIIGLFAASAIAFGPQTITDYLGLMWNATRWDEVNGISIYGMFGWNGLARAMLGTEHESARSILSVLFTAATAALMVIGLRSKRARNYPEFAFASVLAASVLMSPHLYAHDMLVMSLAFVVIGQSTVVGAQRALALAVLFWLTMYFHWDTMPVIRLNTGTAYVAVLFVCVSMFLLIPSSLVQGRHTRSLSHAA
jgi:hypothetical protein